MAAIKIKGETVVLPLSYTSGLLTEQDYGKLRKASNLTIFFHPSPDDSYSINAFRLVGELSDEVVERINSTLEGSGYTLNTIGAVWRDPLWDNEGSVDGDSAAFIALVKDQGNYDQYYFGTFEF